ncbi:MAG: 50S ribosomal protein L22 [Phycisphaerae bacterium]|nr:50S ribosomal protein L22 [Phycisphaerae bacterium]
MAKATTPSEISNPRRWRASWRFARLSPRKARLVIALVRGRRCNEAMNILRFNPMRPAVAIAKVLKSAMTNADEAEADMGRLFVAEARIDAGPTFPRWQPKDRGRAHPIIKKTSHIHIVLAEK